MFFVFLDSRWMYSIMYRCTYCLLKEPQGFKSFIVVEIHTTIMLYCKTSPVTFLDPQYRSMKNLQSIPLVSSSRSNDYKADTCLSFNPPTLHLLHSIEPFSSPPSLLVAFVLLFPTHNTLLISLASVFSLTCSPLPSRTPRSIS